MGSYYEHIEKSTSWDVVDYKESVMEVKEDITPEDLLLALHDAAARVSYFNAGEGDNYRRETDARHAAQGLYNKLKEIAISKGVFNEKEFSRYLA